MHLGEEISAVTDVYIVPNHFAQLQKELRVL